MPGGCFVQSSQSLAVFTSADFVSKMLAKLHTRAALAWLLTPANRLILFIVLLKATKERGCKMELKYFKRKIIHLRSLLGLPWGRFVQSSQSMKSGIYRYSNKYIHPVYVILAKEAEVSAALVARPVKILFYLRSLLGLHWGCFVQSIQSLAVFMLAGFVAKIPANLHTKAALAWL